MLSSEPHNKKLQADNLRGVCFVVSLSLNFTTKQTPHKLRLTAALCEKERRENINMKYLTKAQVYEAIDSLSSETIEFESVRSHDKSDIRKSKTMDIQSFKNMVAESIEEGHLPGGDIEVKIPSIRLTLVGHHDGLYWLE